MATARCAPLVTAGKAGAGARCARRAARCAAAGRRELLGAAAGAAALALAAPARAGLFGGGGPTPEELDAKYAEETTAFVQVVRDCAAGADPLLFRDASRSWLGGWRGNAGGPPGRAKSYGELATAANILGGHYAFSGSVDTMKQKDIDNMLSHLDKAEKALALGI